MFDTELVKEIIEGELPPIPSSSRIFVNRNLRMRNIEMIGFDLDYTIAVYKSPEFEQLCFSKTVSKMISEKGYPESIKSIEFDPEIAQRGLVVDRRTGNMLKMDRFNHVWRALHGRTPLTKEEITEQYRKNIINYSDERFHWFDTLFSLPEVSLFSSIVTELDNGRLDIGRGYDEVFSDIRNCTDLAHWDGSIKSVIKSEPGKFLSPLKYLARTFHRFRSDGKRLFLLTNSGWEYTDKIMSHLLNDELKDYPLWTDYFDVIVIDARKPEFFSSESPFMVMDAARTGKWHRMTKPAFEKGRVYSGGNLGEFETLAGCGGDRALYVGDHIYGDMIRSKRFSLWRTAMVIPELEYEMEVSSNIAREISDLTELEEQRDSLEMKSGRARLARSLIESWKKHPKEGVSADLLRNYDDLTTELEKLHVQLKELNEKHLILQSAVEASFNRFWGSLFREKNETTKFGAQVEDFACIYTSNVTNFSFYSPRQYFISKRTLLPHEGDTEQSDCNLDTRTGTPGNHGSRA